MNHRKIILFPILLAVGIGFATTNSANAFLLGYKLNAIPDPASTTASIVSAMDVIMPEEVSGNSYLFVQTLLFSALPGVKSYDSSNLFWATHNGTYAAGDSFIRDFGYLLPTVSLVPGDYSAEAWLSSMVGAWMKKPNVATQWTVSDIQANPIPEPATLLLLGTGLLGLAGASRRKFKK